MIRLLSTFTFYLIPFTFLYSQTPTEKDIDTDRRGGDTRTGFYQIAKPYDVAMRVNLWGEVSAQGLYVVPTNTDIIQLLSYAGGIRERADVKNIQLFRSVGKDGRMKPFRTININDILQKNSETIQLSPGDLVIVNRQIEDWTWRETLSVTTTSLSLISVLLSIYLVLR